VGNNSIGFFRNSTAMTNLLQLAWSLKHVDDMLCCCSLCLCFQLLHIHLLQIACFLIYLLNDATPTEKHQKIIKDKLMP
jgi:hypothetical protein